MKVVVQRVSEAKVVSGGETVGAIKKGIAALVGIDREDTTDDLEYIVRKLLGVRIWPDEAEKKPWCRSVRDVDGGLLLVSQFTLTHVLKGNKPDFHHAMPPETASQMFNTLRDRLCAEYRADRVATGKFQHYMQVELCNDGPVTLVLDSKHRG